MEVSEVIVKTDEQRLCEVDVFGRDDEAEREGSQDEDRDSRERADDDGLRVVLGRIINIHDVYTHHFHSSVEQEDTAGQDYVVQLCEVWEEALGHIHIVVSTTCHIDDAEDDQKTCRYDRTYHTAPFADLSHPVEAFQGNEGCNPIYCQDRDQSEDLVGGQNCIGGVVKADEGYRYCTECENGRVPDGGFDPLQPYGQEACAGSECLSDPAEYSTLFVGEHGSQFSSDHRGWDQRKSLIDKQSR